MPKTRETRNSNFYAQLIMVKPGGVVKQKHDCADHSNCSLHNAARQWVWRRSLRFNFFHQRDELWAVRLNEED